MGYITMMIKAKQMEEKEKRDNECKRYLIRLDELKEGQIFETNKGTQFQFIKKDNEKYFVVGIKSKKILEFISNVPLYTSK